jgi:hypothetical protein
VGTYSFTKAAIQDLELICIVFYIIEDENISIVKIVSGYRDLAAIDSPFLHRRGSANAQRSAGKERLLLGQT